MAFRSFDDSFRQSLRTRRLVASFAAACAVLAASSLAVVAADARAPARSAEEVLLPVQFQPELPEAESPPEPPAVEPPPSAPMVVPPKIKLNPAAPPPAPLKAPNQVPSSRPEEADPSQDKGVGGVRASDHPQVEPGGTGAGLPEASAQRPPVSSAPPPEPPKQPVAISEGTVPPSPLSTPLPGYPSELKSQGVETRVVCRIKISESGAVTGGTCFQGDTRFHAACVAALRTWRFKPAVGPGGTPVPFVKTVVFPFQIRP
jgi:protein TonB